jgi:RNA polymerase sigma factor (sigma-70 family)
MSRGLPSPAPCSGTRDLGARIVGAIRARHEGSVQRDLVERAQGGDRESFGALVRASIDRLYDAAQLMVRDGDLADDAVQEALIVAWRDLRGLRDPDRFDGWLYRILVRCVYRLAKSERRRRVGPGRVVSIGDWTTPGPAGELENRDEIDRAFRRIRPEFRAVLVLHHHLGLSDDEAAEVLGVPAGTVKSRLNRATSALRAEIDAHGRAGAVATGTIR